MYQREFRNPQGLNKILSEVLGHPISGDWDIDLPSDVYIGKWKKDQVKGKTSQEWGKQLEKCACLYITKELEKSGWKVFHNLTISENEYDCVGWKGKPEDRQCPDLVIEMYFPIPKREHKYEFEYVRKKTDQMVRRLEKINAKYKYIVIGVPRDRKITTKELLHPNIKVMFQEYRFTNVRLLKRKIINDVS